MKTFKHLFAVAILLLCVAFLKATNNNHIAWKFETNRAIHATPTIDDTVLYVGCNNKYFYAINTNTGLEIWNFETNYSINSKAIIKDSLVIFESGFKLYALNKTNGSLQWNYVASEVDPEMSLGLTDYHHSSPIINDGIVYYGDGWGNMNGVDLITGALKFQYTVITDSAAIRTTPAIFNNKIFFGDWAGHVYSVSLTDTSLQWKYSLENRRPYYGMTTSKMLIKDSVLYFGSQHDVFAPIHTRTGKPVWSFTDPNETYLPSTPVFYDNSVIIGSTVNTWKIYCLNEGNVKWSCDTEGIFFVEPVIVDSVLIMNSSNFGSAGTMFFVNANNGDRLGEYHFNKAAPASPVVCGNKLFVGNGDGNLYAFNLGSLLDGVINKNDTMSVTMDTTTIFKSIENTENKQNISIEIENVGVACDSVLVESEIISDNNSDGIILPKSDYTHIGLDQVYKLRIRIDPAALESGLYTVKIAASSYRHSNIVFEKTINIEIVDNSTGFNKKLQNSLKVYPNPALHAVNFDINEFTHDRVSLRLYSLNGTLVYNYIKPANQESIHWDLVNANGQPCLAGTYIYKLQTTELNATGSIIIAPK